jgi:hypothetical protein
MQQYKEAGLGGLEITPIYGVKGHESEFIDFLSPRWMEMLQHTLTGRKTFANWHRPGQCNRLAVWRPLGTPADACKELFVKTYVKRRPRTEMKYPLYTTTFYRSESGMKVDLAKLSQPIATIKICRRYAFDQVKFEVELKPSTVVAYNGKGDFGPHIKSRCARKIQLAGRRQLESVCIVHRFSW